VALSLLRQGWQLVALGRSRPDHLIAWAEAQDQALKWVPLDLQMPDWSVLDALPVPQALFHCAVSYSDDLALMMQVNAIAPIALIESTLAKMAPATAGRIGVFLGQNGRLGLPGLGAFSATQAALWTWAEAKSRQLAQATPAPALASQPADSSPIALSPIALSLVFPPRAPSHLQQQLAAQLRKPPKVRHPPNADALVRGVLAGQRRVGRHPWLAALATLTW